MAADGAGNLYIADYNNNAIRKISSTGNITTVAGGLGCMGAAGNGDAATSVCLGYVDCVRFDKSGNMYISENIGNHIWKVNAAGIANTVTTDVDYATGMAFDTAGNLYFVENVKSRVRKINTAGIISTIAGTGTPGFSGDGGPATAAMLNFPNGVVVDSAGNVYIADTQNGRVRQIAPSGIITTYAGNGMFFSSGDGGPAAAAGIGRVHDVVLDSLGDLFITSETETVRKISRFTYPSSISEITPEQILIYPNPASRFISISLPDLPEHGRLQLFSGLGTLVLDCDLRDSVDISALSVGFYTLKLMMDDRVFYKKIVKG